MPEPAEFQFLVPSRAPTAVLVRLDRLLGVQPGDVLTVAPWTDAGALGVYREFDRSALVHLVDAFDHLTPRHYPGRAPLTRAQLLRAVADVNWTPTTLALVQ